MNKKQLIVLWCAAVLFCGVLLVTPKVRRGYKGYVLNWAVIFPLEATVLVIGGLLVYTLKDRA